MSAEFELLITQALSRARFLERALHDQSPWLMVAYGAETECRVPADRVILGSLSRVSLTAYIPRGCEGIHAVELYCGTGLVMSRPVTSSPSAPCRITIGAGIGAPEPAW